MRRVPPSTIVPEDIQRLLAGGVEPATNIVSALAELGLGLGYPAGPRAGAGGSLGRGRYERAVDGRGLRNRYEDAVLRTAEGGVAVRVPQVRDGEGPYRSKLMEFLQGNSDVLERLVTEMYAQACPRATSRTPSGTLV